MNDTYDNLTALVDASTTDRELTLIAAAATAVAAPQLASDLRRVRDQMRAAVRPKTLTDEEIVVQSVLDLGIAELITHATTNEQIDAYVTAAEAGAGGPLFGLKAELTRLRDAEAAEAAEQLRAHMDYTRIDSRDPFCPTALPREDTGRVFVSTVGGPVYVHAADPASSTTVPRIANLGESAADFVEPGEAGCRYAYSYHVPGPVNRGGSAEPRIANLHETAEERRRIDAIKANLRIEDL